MKRRRRIDSNKAEESERLNREWTARMVAALSGDERAYRRLLEDAAQLAARVARKALRGFSIPSHDVDDIVQETLLAIHANRRRWRAEAGALPWITAIARYKAIDAIRLACARPTTPIDDEAHCLVDSAHETPGARLDVQRLMAPLRPRQRAFVTEVMLNGGTVAEVAQSLKMSAVAGRVTLHRAMRTMAAAVAAPKRERFQRELRRTGAQTLAASGE